MPKFQEKNAQVIALAVQNEAGAKTSAKDTGATYPILADPDHAIADAYGVYNLLNDRVATPSVFVINKSGQVVWSHVGKNISDRPDNETILDKLPPS